MIPTLLAPYLDGPAVQQTTDGSLALSLHVQPGARTTGIVGLHGDRLKVRLAAPPVDGRANKALLAWLADLFGVPRSAVELTRGASSRQKTVRVQLGR